MNAAVDEVAEEEGPLGVAAAAAAVVEPDEDAALGVGVFVAVAVDDAEALVDDGTLAGGTVAAVVDVIVVADDDGAEAGVFSVADTRRGTQFDGPYCTKTSCPWRGRGGDGEPESKSGCYRNPEPSTIKRHC